MKKNRFSSNNSTDCEELEKVVREMKLSSPISRNSTRNRVVTDEVFSTIKRTLKFENEVSERYIFSLITIPRSKNIEGIKNLIEIVKENDLDRELYCAWLHKRNQKENQILDQNYDLVEDFLTYSFTRMDNDSGNELNNFEEDFLDKSIYFSKIKAKNNVIENLTCDPANEDQYKNSSREKMFKTTKYECYTEKELLIKLKKYDFDLFLLTDNSNSGRNYELIKEHMLEEFYDQIICPRTILRKSIISKNDFFSENQLQRIEYLLLNTTEIFENDPWFLDKNSDFETIRLYINRRNEIEKEKIKFVEEAIDSDLELLELFFEKIEKQEWDGFIGKLKRSVQKNEDKYIFLALKENDHMKLIENIKKSLFLSGEEDLEKKKLNCDLVPKNPLHYIFEESKQIVEKSQHENFAHRGIRLIIAYKINNEIANGDFIFHEAAAGITLGDETIKLVIFKGSFLPDIYKDHKDSSKGLFWKNQWFLVFSEVKDYIMVMFPEKEKYIDIDIILWFETKINAFLTDSPVKTLYRKHDFLSYHEKDSGFKDFWFFNGYTGYNFHTFSNRNNYYDGFIKLLKNFIEDNDLEVVSTYQTNKSYQFIKSLNVTDEKYVFKYYDDEIIFTTSKDYLDRPKRVVNPDYMNEARIYSRIEFYITFASKLFTEKLDCVIRLDIFESFKENKIIRYLFKILEKGFSKLQLNFDSYLVDLLSSAFTPSIAEDLLDSHFKEEILEMVFKSNIKDDEIDLILTKLATTLLKNAYRENIKTISLNHESHENFDDLILTYTDYIITVMKKIKKEKEFHRYKVDIAIPFTMSSYARDSEREFPFFTYFQGIMKKFNDKWER